jgi:hypothetical protein
MSTAEKPELPVGTLRTIAFRMELEIVIPEGVAPLKMTTDLGHFDVQPLWLRVPYDYDMVSAKWRMGSMTVYGRKGDIALCEHHLAEMPVWLRETVEHHRPNGTPVVLNDKNFEGER